jgi:hypothetical protein
MCAACPCASSSSQANARACTQDLESRKRAPLYQKKQEEELRAAIEKAREADIRASDAESAMLEAQVNHSGGGVFWMILCSVVPRLAGINSW